MRVLAIGLGAVVLATCFGILWTFFYSGDLPDMKALAQFAPARTAHVSDPCLAAAYFAIPYQSIGDSLQAALMAVEAGEDDPGVLYQEYRAIRDLKVSYKTPLSVRISRSMFRGPSKTLNREVAELRMAVQLERRFSRRELFTIFANRAWFGDAEPSPDAALFKPPAGAVERGRWTA